MEFIARRDIAFPVEDTIVRGWLYVPQTGEIPYPTVVMAHGFAAVKEMYLDRYAEVFASAGMAVLVFDYRGIGASDGTPRQEINPWQQIEDYRSAVTYACTLPEVDAGRIGVWGTSYSGGHVLVLAATDKRVKCVVSQVPSISGYQNALRRVPAERVNGLYAAFHEDRVKRMQGEPPTMMPIVSRKIDENPAFRTEDATEWYEDAGSRAENWKNEITLRSVEYSRAYEPGIYISRISPTPLLLIVAQEDTLTPTDLALKAYEEALEPKKLVLIPGGHFDPYLKLFGRSSAEAVQWLTTHLIEKK